MDERADELVVRNLRPEDYDQLLSLWNLAGLSCRCDGRDSRESFNRQLSEPMSIFLVAELNGRMVASVLCTQDGRKGWINRLAVAPDLRRQGIATLLIKECERRLEREGIEVIAVLIEDWNQTSVRLFQGLDYLYDPHIMYLSKRKSSRS